MTSAKIWERTKIDKGGSVRDDEGGREDGAAVT